MNIFRRIGLSLTIVLFSLCISALIVLISIRSVVDTPQPLEKALSNSGIYSSLVQNIITQQLNNSSSPAASDADVQKALEQALSPSFLQQSTEKVINTTYGWAQGSTANPDFSIDLSSVKSAFADNIATLIQQRLNTLPQCPPGTAPPTTSDEVMSLSCLPRGIPSTNLTGVVRQETLSSNLFPTGNTLDINSIKNAQGQTLTDQLSIIPIAHQYYVYALYIIPILTILLSVAIIFLSSTKRSGIKRIAWPFITTGITSVIAAILGVWLLNEAVTRLGAAASGAIQDKMLLVIQTIVNDMRIWWIWLGGGYIVLGIILLVIVRLTRPRPDTVTTVDALSNPTQQPTTAATTEHKEEPTNDNSATPKI